MGSVWTDDLRMPCFPPLWGQARTDVLIIGGGMAGLLCARMLQNAGWTAPWRRRLPSPGASRRTPPLK